MRHFQFLVLAIAAGVFAAGCTQQSTAPAPITGGSNATTPIDEHEGHDHEGHSHEGEAAATPGETVTPAPLTGEASPGDQFGTPPSEPQEGAAAEGEPEISLDPAAPAAPETE
jgi:hypothetical protein